MITWVLLTILLGTAGELLTLPAAPGSAVLLQVPAVAFDQKKYAQPDFRLLSPPGIVLSLVNRIYDLQGEGGER